MDIKKANSNTNININNNFKTSEININNINVTKSNVNTNNLDKEMEYVDISESNIKEGEYEEYLKEVEIYEKDLDTQKKDYETELKYIEDRLAVLKWMTEIEPGKMKEHQLTGEALGYDKIAEEIKKEYDTQEKLKEYKQNLEEDQIVLNAAIYKFEQLKKTAKYDNLKNLKEYQDFEVTTQHHQEEMDKQFNEFKKFDQKSKIEANSSNYIDDELALLIELNDEESIKIYNYLYEKEGKEEADKYLDDIKDTLHDQVGMLRAQEYLSTLKKDENGNYDNASIMNHLNASIKGGTTGVKSFFQGLKTWFEKDQIYSTDEYETMYILQALQENKSFTNFLDNNFEISQSVGNMLPSVIIGQVACPLLGTISMGASAGGNSYHQARVSGKSTGASVSYGVLSGLSEATLQHFLGSIPGLNEVPVTSLKTFIQSMGKEGFEELVQEYIDAGLQDVILNEEQDPLEVTKNAGKSFVYGALTSGILKSAELGSKKVSSDLKDSDSSLYKIGEELTTPKLGAVDPNVLFLMNLFDKSKKQKPVNFETPIDAGVFFEDPRVYMNGKMKELIKKQALPDNIKIQLEALVKNPTCYIDQNKIANLLWPYLSNKDRKTINKMIANFPNTNYGKWQSSLQPKHYDAIYCYTKKGGFELNAVLRKQLYLSTKNGNIYGFNGLDGVYYNWNSPGALKAVQEFIYKGNGKNISQNSDMLSALDEITNYFYLQKPITVYRGIYNLGPNINMNDLTIGQVFDDGGAFASTSLFNSTSPYALSFVKNRPYILEINVPEGNHGAFIEPISGVNNYNQMEFLLRRNTKYEIKEFYKNEMGQVVIKCDVI